MRPIPDEMALDGYVEWIRDHNKQDMDSVIMITGYEGLGKSTFATWLAYELDRKFKIAQIVFYDVKDFWKQAKNEEHYRVIMSDEAMKFLLAYDWMKGETKAIITELAFCRYRRKFFIFIVPSRKKVVEYVRDHRALFWVYVRDRGRVDLHIGDIQGESYKWYEQMKWKMVGKARYPDLPQRIKERYQARKAEEKVLDEQRGMILSSKYILNLLSDGLLDGHVSTKDNKGFIKAHTYMALEEMFPYSNIPKGRIGVAVDIWAN